MKCAESLVITPHDDGTYPVKVDDAGDAARAGTAFHAWAAGFATGEHPDITALAETHGVDAEDLRMLCHQGTRYWHKQLKTWFEGGDFEVSMEHTVEFPYHGFTHLRLTGTADNRRLLGIEGHNRLFVHDWKSGRLVVPCVHQRMGYAFLSSRDVPNVQHVASGVLVDPAQYTGLGAVCSDDR